MTALPKNLNQVKLKAETIKNVLNKTFWATPSVGDLEEVRVELRSIMHLKDAGPKPPPPTGPTIIDISDGDVMRIEMTPKLEGMELREFRKKVEQVLHDHFEDDQTLLKIRAGEPVTADDLESLRDLVLELDEDVDLNALLAYQPEFAGHLDLALRSIVGIDPEAVDAHFNEFAQSHHGPLNAKQLKFIQLLKNHISKYGLIERDQLWQEPFTQLDAEGVDGVFDEDLVSELLDLISPYESPKPLLASTTSTTSGSEAAS